jgi:hypothetical protein
MTTNLIISQKVTSLSDSFIGCGIDKLVLQLGSPFKLEDIRSKLFSMNYLIVFKKNKEFKSNILLERNGRQIYCYGYSLPDNNFMIYKLGLKPNLFSGTKEVFRSLIEIFGKDIIWSAIRRIDINFDFRLKFIELLKIIDIQGKQKTFEYLSYSGKLTSIRHGDTDPIKVYDRARKLKTNDNLSRIEFVFSFKKDQFNFIDYEKAILEVMSRQNINKILFLEPEIPFELSIDLFDKEFKKFIQFFCLYEHYGFTQAKKIFNENCNFYREYKKTISCKKNSFNLKEVFHQHFSERGLYEK